MRVRRLGIPKVPGLLMARIRARYGADLPLWDHRPRGLYLMHNALGVVIHPGTRFTGPAVVFHQTTFGNAWTAGAEGTPTIGAYVFVGVGAKILGPVTVGDHCVIGANTVVTRDVPPAHMAFGSPMQVRPIDPQVMLRTCFDQTS